MPLPSEPLVLRGGCNCTAVRWRMSLPEASKRVANPYHTPGTDIGDVRLPTAVLCHCDGCRAAMGSLGAYGFTSDMALLELSILPRTSVPEKEKGKDDDTRPPYVPATSLMDDPAVISSSDLWLTHYESSPKRDRLFCGRCGSQIAVAASKDAIPPEWGWPRVVNIWAGTLDRDMLENDWCRPDHIMDCSIAIPWIRDHVKNGARDAQEHPFIMIDWHMTDDFRPHIEMLKQMGVTLDVTMWKAHIHDLQEVREQDRLDLSSQQLDLSRQMLKHIEDTQVLLEIVVIGGQVDHGRENEEGDMLLSKAAAGGHRRAVRALLYGSHDDINTRDKMGRTPLFWAAEGGHLDVVRELVKEGAEVSFEDQDNFTAKDLAYRRGHSEIVSLLEPLMQRDDEKGKLI